MGDCHSTSRPTVTKRLESAVASRCMCRRANIRCEVEEPMSMPTVVSSTLSADQIASASCCFSSGSAWKCSNSSSCILRGLEDALVDVLAHAGFHAVFREFCEEDAVDTRVLVPVVDLPPALVDVDDDAAELRALFAGEGIAQAPQRDREVACRHRRGVEVLVEHHVRRREHGAVLPVDAHEVLALFVPEERIPMAGDGEHVEVRPV